MSARLRDHGELVCISLVGIVSTRPKVFLYPTLVKEACVVGCYVVHLRNLCNVECRMLVSLLEHIQNKNDTEKSSEGHWRDYLRWSSPCRPLG